MPPAPIEKPIDAAIAMLDARIAPATVDAAVDAAPADATIDAGRAETRRCRAPTCWLEGAGCVTPTTEGAGVGGTGPTPCSSCSSKGICIDGGGRRCVAPWTPIDTPTGPRAISELHTGDLVFSIEDGRRVTVPIGRISTTSTLDHHAIELVLDDGTRRLISPGHPMADHRDVASLVAGERIGPRTIVSATLVRYPHAATYDILPVSGSGAYFSGGIPLGSTLR